MGKIQFLGTFYFTKPYKDTKNVFPLLKFSLSIGNICQLDECTVIKTEGPSHFLSLFQSDPSVLAGSWLGHTDAVWGLAYSGIKNRLLSCSADGTVKLWNPTEKNPCISTFNTNHGKKKKKGALLCRREFEQTCWCLHLSTEHGIPTSVDFNGCDPAHMVASFNSGDVVVYDLETSQQALVLKGQGDGSKSTNNHEQIWGVWWVFEDSKQCYPFLSLLSSVGVKSYK